jgi:hypothetical protein
MDKKITIGIGILSWRSHKTLRSSLDSYAQNGFLDMFDEKVIYFSDIDAADKELANIYGWTCVGGANQGIAGGMKNLALNMSSDYIILLQNDNPIVEKSEFSVEHIKNAVRLLHEGKADLARLRHRWQVGEGFVDVEKYLGFFAAQNISCDFVEKFHNIQKGDYKDSVFKMLKRLFRKDKANRLLGRSVFIEDQPEKIYPKYIKRYEDFLIIDSSVINFTDQCILISRHKWLDIFVRYFENNPSSRVLNGFQVPEICINGKWWRNKHYKILQGRGVFSHSRYDGSFRSNHKSNQTG